MVGLSVLNSILYVKAPRFFVALTAAGKQFFAAADAEPCFLPPDDYSFPNTNQSVKF